METRRSRVVPLALLLAALMMMFVAACGDDEEPSGGDGGGESAATADLSGELGPAEDKEITVAIPFPDVTMYSMYIVGTDLGYYEEEGLKVKVITADDVNAAVASGSADIGVNSAGAAIEAIRNDIGVTILGGHYCRQNFDFAVQPDVNSVEDLDGTDIVLAGTPGDPAEFQRSRVLKEEGWDVDSVDAKVVYPGPDSATWREFFVADKVSLVPFYGDDRPALEKYGAKIIIESIRNWANDVHIVGEDYLKENPNTAVRFLRATIKSVDFMIAPGVGELPENKDKVLDIYEANDHDVADLRSQESPWVLDGHLMCENLYYDKAAWDTTIETEQLDPLDFSVDLSYLEKAQELTDRDNAPASEISYP
jgi:NitT/TauT family transport system substrate-binding protein